MPTTLFDAPSPTGRNDARLHLDSKGRLLDRHGNFWGRSAIAGMAQDGALKKPRRKLAYDDQSATNVGTGEKARKPFNPVVSAARNDLNSALKQLCEASGWPHDEVVDAVDDILEQHENEQLQALAAQAGVAGKGAGALDDDDTDDPDEKLRRLLSSKGLDDADVERAIEWAHRDRKEAADRIPKNGLHGTGGHTSRGPSGSSRDNEADFEREFPDAAYTTRDVYGAPASEQSDPVRRLGERAAERLPGGGTSRRLAAGDMAFDEEQQIEREYGRGPGIGMFGG